MRSDRDKWRGSSSGRGRGASSFLSAITNNCKYIGAGAAFRAIAGVQEPPGLQGQSGSSRKIGSARPRRILPGIGYRQRGASPLMPSVASCSFQKMQAEAQAAIIRDYLDDCRERPVERRQRRASPGGRRRSTRPFAKPGKQRGRDWRSEIVYQTRDAASGRLRRGSHSFQRTTAEPNENGMLGGTVQAAESSRITALIDWPASSAR